MSDEENDGVSNEEGNSEEENNEEEENEEENSEKGEDENEEKEDQDEEGEGDEEKSDQENEEKKEDIEKSKNYLYPEKFEILAPIAESKIEIIGGKNNNNSSVFNKSLFNNELFNNKNRKKSLLNVLTEINKDLDLMKNDLNKKKIFNQYKPSSIKPIKRDELFRNNEDDEEKSTISDMKYTNRKPGDKYTTKKNKKLQVEIENYYKNNEKLSRRIESLKKVKDKGGRDSDRDLLSDLEKSEAKKDKNKEKPYEASYEKPYNNKNNYNDHKSKYLERDRNHENSPSRNNQFYNTTNNINRHNYNNNFHRHYTKNLENNHYRTIEDLYKRSPKAPVYYSRESSKNKKVNNYNELNNILNKKYTENENIRINDNYGNYNQKHYDSDNWKNKPKYNITNAMNILLDKEKI